MTDLEPVVAAGTRTARAIATVRRSQRERRVFGVVALIGVVGGGSVAAIAHHYDRDKLAIGAAAVGVLLLGVGVLLRGQIEREIGETTHAGFEHYNDALAQRLQVCARGLDIVLCDSGAELPIFDEPDPAIRSLRQK